MALAAHGVLLHCKAVSGSGKSRDAGHDSCNTCCHLLDGCALEGALEHDRHAVWLWPDQNSQSLRLASRFWPMRRQGFYNACPARPACTPEVVRVRWVSVRHSSFHSGTYPFCHLDTYLFYTFKICTSYLPSVSSSSFYQGGHALEHIRHYIRGRLSIQRLFRCMFQHLCSAQPAV